LDRKESKKFTIICCVTTSAGIDWAEQASIGLNSAFHFAECKKTIAIQYGLISLAIHRVDRPEKEQ
jgi:hypothetical protein